MSMILPPLPKALKALATDRQPALSTTEIISSLRQSDSGMVQQVGEALDRHQQYVDSNGNYTSLIVDYLDGLTKTGNTAGGDLSGTLPDPTVIAIQGNAVEDAVPNDGDLLVWVDANSQWEPTAIGDLFPAWTSFTPTVTNVTGITTRGKYQQIGKTCNFTLYVKATTDVSGTLPTFSLPVTAASNDHVFASNQINGATLFTRPCTMSGGVIILALSGNLTALTQFEWLFTGVFQTT